MPRDGVGLRQAARSGWVPAALVLAFLVQALMSTGVRPDEVLRFAAYCALGLVLPGVALWRLLVPAYAGNLATDVVVGTSMGYAGELFAYLVCTHFGFPGVAFLWPAAPLAVSFLPRFRSRVWRSAERQPLWWSWSMAAVVLVATGGLIRLAASISLSSHAQTPFFDMPLHLSLIAALSKHAPTDLPYLASEPLYYHWFFHAHAAAAGHATGIEHLVLLNRLCPVPLHTVVVLGAAVLTQRLSRSALAGLGASALLVLASVAPVAPGWTQALDPTVTLVSPTTTYAEALLVGCIAISAHLLTQRRPTWAEWLCAAAFLAALSGAKSTVLPIVLGGYVTILVLRPLARRALPVGIFGLVGLTVGVELLAQRVLYGGSTRGMSLRPLGIAAHYAKDLRMVKLPEDASMSVVVSIAVVFTVGAVAYGAGTLGLFTKDVWRDPRAQFVVGAAVAGVLGTLAFDHPSRNEVYFLRVTPLPLAVASAWGLAVLARRPPRSLALVVGSSFLVAGFTVGTVLRALKPDSLARTAPRPPTDLVVVGQTLLLLAIVGAVAIALSVLARNSRRLAGVAPLACVALVLGTGLAATALPAVRRLFPSHDNHTPVSAGVPPAIGTGGIPAARWLRDHSDPAAVIATNAHCRIPKARPCDHRTMWIAGFTERQVLIEGWAYSWKTAAEGERQGHTIPFVEYWKPQLLADNDRVFEHPTPASVARLHDLYGVDWLFADKRLGVDLPALERVAQRRHEEGQYAVFRIG